MAFVIISAIVLALAVFGLVVGLFGFASFDSVYQNEYAVSTYHMADTATLLVNGDHLDDYLAGDMAEEYERTRTNLDVYCNKISVSLLYVIQVDRGDYRSFVSIFNSVDNSVDNTSYTPWELGYERETTNDEYRKKYKALYEQESLYETVYRVKTKDGQNPHITTLVPVKNSSGNVVAILCMQRPIREIRDARNSYLYSIIISTAVLALLASVFAAGFVRYRLIAPIRKVSDEASRFARENTKGKALGNISGFAELSRLASSIDTMEADMTCYIENLTRVTAEKERIGTELNLATRIQAAMLPNIFPAFPERTEFDIYANMHPAKEVGGDFYDFFLVDRDHLCMVMADVSGKGVPAALFMMASRIIIANNAKMGKSPAQILADTNASICQNNREEMFVTVWLGILEISTGKLTAANAGHEYPAISKRGGGFELFKDKHGFVIGGLDGVKYSNYELELEHGDKVFVYTDGVAEAMNRLGELFGTDRMLGALNEAPEASPEQILNNVLRATNEFAKDTEQFDDLTMLCVEYKG